ncbi:unnamed protein product [Paramecium sonneborni]|uniref:Uncharacterized protein n=1 Tax=Paramecium sonneborni TaxID=65129 RepID=A0A8S1R9Y6_9CILI|nr:unnamed protein product [Paramecium sonneborni]
MFLGFKIMQNARIQDVIMNLIFQILMIIQNFLRQMDHVTIIRMVDILLELFLQPHQYKQLIFKNNINEDHFWTETVCVDNKNALTTNQVCIYKKGFITKQVGACVFQLLIFKKMKMNVIQIQFVHSLQQIFIVSKILEVNLISGQNKHLQLILFTQKNNYDIHINFIHQSFLNIQAVNSIITESEYQTYENSLIKLCRFLLTREIKNQLISDSFQFYIS